MVVQVATTCLMPWWMDYKHHWRKPGRLVSETGWPSDGNGNVTTPSNAQTQLELNKARAVVQWNSKAAGKLVRRRSGATLGSVLFEQEFRLSDQLREQKIKTHRSYGKIQFD
ncbi:hypothetical protein ACFX13_034184 [Malus domestica]